RRSRRRGAAVLALPHSKIPAALANSGWVGKSASDRSAARPTALSRDHGAVCDENQTWRPETPAKFLPRSSHHRLGYDVRQRPATCRPAIGPAKAGTRDLPLWRDLSGCRHGQFFYGVCRQWPSHAVLVLL